MAGKWILKTKFIIYDLPLWRGKVISLLFFECRKTKRIFHSLGGCKTFLPRIQVSVNVLMLMNRVFRGHVIFRIFCKLKEPYNSFRTSLTKRR